MGIIYGKSQKQSDSDNQKLHDTIDHLHEQVEDQRDRMCLMENEIESLRYLKTGNTVDSNVVDLINKSRIDHDYDYLVFSGGGIKGLSYCGALHVLEELNILYDKEHNLKIRGVAGTSAGSIIAALFAVGYTPDELYTIIKDLDFEKVFDDKLGYIRDTINFIEDWGVCPGKYIQTLLGKLIKKKTGNEDYTLEDLKNDHNMQLVTVATDMCNKKSIYMYAGNPNKKYSNIPIRLAVRMSMGIPFAFEPLNYDECYFVDGGILDNFPLHVFDGEYPGETKARLNLIKPNPKVLGLKIMTSNNDLDYDIVNKEQFKSIFDYAMSYITTFLVENDRRIMTPSFWLRTIIIVTPDYPLTKSDMSDKEKDKLVSLGSKYVKDFFDSPKKLIE